MQTNQIVNFKGTKSRGSSWNTFINDIHFKGHDKNSIYGKVFAIQGKEIWVYVFDAELEEKIDTSTWGFLECDLL